MPACASCSSPAATLRCAACAAHQAPSRIVHYCNKTCQKAHWETHKVDCYIARLYACSPLGWRGASWSPEDQVMYERSRRLFGKLPHEVAKDFVEYFNVVPPEAMPQYPTAASHMKAVSHANEFKIPKDEYMKAWEARVPAAMRELCYTDDEWKVPFNLRPLRKVTNAGGGQGELIGLFPQDFQVLSFEDFRRHFGGDQMMGMDPWRAKNGGSGTLGTGDGFVEVRGGPTEDGDD